MDTSTDDKKTNNPFDSLKQVFDTTTETISSTVNSATQNISSRISPDYSSYFSNNYLYLGLLLVIIICAIIAYFLYRMITTKLFLNIKEIANDTRVPVLCNERNSFEFKFEKTGNGERRSYTFWIYIHDLNQFKGNYRNVFSIRSDEKEVNKITNASPFVFLDETQNRLYVRFRDKNDETTSYTYSQITKSSLCEIMKTGIVVPYVPLQRWVHIAIVCNANSYKNYIYAYVDGDLVNTSSTGENDKYIDNCGITKDYKNIDLNMNGVLKVGGVQNDISEGSGFSGLVSKITTYNYEINQKDVFEDYYSGPIGGFLAKIGLGMYGIRSPIYKL